MPRAIDKLCGGHGAGAHVDAYMQYRELVGDLDEGRLLPEAVYEALVKKASDPARRLFVNYRNTRTGLDCKAVGPASQCFCGHRYREHAWDEFESRQVGCKMRGCSCKCFSYIPVRGSQFFRCSGCKRPNTDHDVVSRKCPGAQRRFTASTVCSCTDGYEDHETVFESAAERESAGRLTDSEWMQQAAAKGLPVCHLGGIMGFASLADGIDRAQAGLEPGFEEMYAGLDDRGFAANMAMRDDIASASVVRGKEAGHRALAKYKTPSGSVRPNERAIQDAQHQRAGLPRPSLPGAGSSTPGRASSPSLGRAGGAIAGAAHRGSGPGRPSSAGPATAPRIHTLHDVPSAQQSPPRPPGPTAKATAKVAAAPKAKAKAAAGHRLGGARVQSEDGMRRARLKALDGPGTG